MATLSIVCRQFTLSCFGVHVGIPGGWMGPFNQWCIISLSWGSVRLSFTWWRWSTAWEMVTIWWALVFGIFKMMKLLFLGLLAKNKRRICDEDDFLWPGPCLGLQYILFLCRISSVCPCFCHCLLMACFGPPSCVEEFWPRIFWTFPWLLYVFLIIRLGLRKEEHGNTMFSFCSIKVQSINMTSLGGLALLTYPLTRSLLCLFHSIPYFLKDVSIPGHTYKWALYSPTRARNLPKLYGFFTWPLLFIYSVIYASTWTHRRPVLFSRLCSETDSFIYLFIFIHSFSIYLFSHLFTSLFVLFIIKIGFLYAAQAVLGLVL